MEDEVDPITEITVVNTMLTPQQCWVHALRPKGQILTENLVQDFVVTGLVLKYKLVGGRYQRDHNRLEVQQTSRYFVNLYYDSLLEKSA